MERKGIYKTNKFPQRMCEVFNQEKGLLTDKSLCLGAAEDGTIFIGTEKGLNYRKKDGTFGSFSCGSVTVIAQGKDGVVFFASGKTVNKFENFSGWERGKNSIAHITENTNAFMNAKVIKTEDVGTHIVFFAEVTEAKVL